MPGSPINANKGSFFFTQLLPLLLFTVVAITSTAKARVKSLSEVYPLQLVGAVVKRTMLSLATCSWTRKCSEHCPIDRLSQTNEETFTYRLVSIVGRLEDHSTDAT